MVYDAEKVIESVKKHDILCFYSEILQEQQYKAVSCDIRLKFVLPANHSLHCDVDGFFNQT